MNHQRGAISIIAAASMVVAVLAVALALDIGRIIYERQRLQGVADAAALAGAQVLATEGDHNAAKAAARDAGAKNGDFDTLDPQIGHLTRAGGLRDFGTGPGDGSPEYDAVQVIATHKVPRSLVAGGLLSGDDAVLTTRAVTHLEESIAAITVGSHLLELDSERSKLLNSLLSALLGTTVDLDAVSYNNLLGTGIKLADIMVQAGVGTIDELLSLEAKPVSEVFDWMLKVLEDEGSIAAIAFRDATRDIGANLTVPLDPLKLSDLLAVSNMQSALDAQLNVLDLLVTAAQVANKGNAVDLGLATPGLLADLGLASLSVKLLVVEPPQIAIGPPGKDENGEWRTVAKTGQLRLHVSLRALEIDLVVLKAPISLDLVVEAASAEARLTAIHRPSPSVPATRVDVEADPQLAFIGIGKECKPAVVPSPLLAATVKLLELPVADVTANLGACSSFGILQPPDLEFSGPFPSDPQAAVTPTGEALLTGLDSLVQSATIQVKVTPLGAPELSLDLGTTLRPLLQGLLVGLIGNLADSVLGPLLDLLGVQLGGADVTVLDASVGQVRLVR
ncbi:MAG: pilus assembly protein TadG-related protein [Thiohalomonadaceae bacterium]